MVSEPELGGNDTLDTGGDGGIEDVHLNVRGEGTEGADDGILAFEGVGEGVNRFEIDIDGLDV